MRNEEHDIQARTVGYLRSAGVRFFAVPNGGLRDKRTACRLWQQGVEAGVPDLVIIDPPPALKGFVGTVIEVKARKGRLDAVQARWLEDFAMRGWLARCVHGKEALLALLCELGYLDKDKVTQREGGASCASGGGSSAPSRPAVAPERAAAARSRATGARRAQPKMARGGAA